jgi:acyl-CoA thioesterase-2
MDETAAARATADLITLLNVEQHGPDLFCGPRKPGGVGRVFGGQVLAQALASAQHSVDPDREPHSLHAYFLRGASEDHEIEFRVERDFDGRTFSNRRIIASQLGRPIFNMAASFQAHEQGFGHQDTMPDVPPPEALESEAVMALRPEYAGHPGMSHRQHVAPAVEIRPANLPPTIDLGNEPAQTFNWIRIKSGLGEDPALHRAVLTYISDLVLLGTAMLPHMAELAVSKMTIASLDHAIRFHDDFRADDWMLYASHSPWAGHARGYARGLIYRRDGRLAASISQEGLMRMTKK